MINDTYNNPLSQRVFDSCKEVLELSPNEGFNDLSTISTLGGDPMGTIKVYHGKRLQKMLISEFNTGPGMVSSLIVIKPDYCFDVPRFGSDFSLMGDKLHLDMDLFPHKDLAADIDYYNRFYAPFHEDYLKATSDHTSLLPRGLWMRNYISPVFFMAETDTNQQANLTDVAVRYFSHWLTIWNANDRPLDDKQTQLIKNRTVNFEQLASQNNPVKGLFTKILGPETTERILAALY